MRVVALNKFEYANKLRLPGEEFDTDSDKDAEILQIAQRVKIVETATRQLKADDDSPRNTATSEAAINKRRYNTRRLQSED
jgi:hypothetical protein